MKYLQLLLLLAFIGISSQANAIAVWGNMSCSHWKEVRQGGSNGPYADEKLSQEHWIVGLLSGMAVWSNTDFLNGVQPDTMFSEVDYFCSKNPSSDTAQAALKFYESLQAKSRK